MKEIKLIKVEPGRNNNKIYNMKDNENGTFTAQWGRVGSLEQQKTYPMNLWGKKYQEKIKKQYEDVTSLFLEIADISPHKEIENSSIKKLMDDLLFYAKQTIIQNYTVTSNSVTKKQINETQNVINDLIKLHNIDEINRKLTALYKIIPRKMKKVSDHLLQKFNKKEFDQLVASEQSLLDVMRGQVISVINSDDQHSQKDQTILESLNLSVVETSTEEKNEIKRMMGESKKYFANAFRIKSIKRDEQLRDLLLTKKNIKIDLLWHGSGNQNWFNILKEGLLIRPTNSIYTGSFFGDGIYFANLAKKSIGYTSLKGSYWARGINENAYLSLFKVFTGKSYLTKRGDNSLNYEKLKKIGNYDSVFAERGADLVNDEIIIYNSSQCAIEFLIELKF